MAVLKTRDYFIPIDFHLLSSVGKLPFWWFCNAKSEKLSKLAEHGWRFWSCKWGDTVKSPSLLTWAGGAASVVIDEKQIEDALGVISPVQQTLLSGPTSQSCNVSAAQHKGLVNGGNN